LGAAEIRADTALAARIAKIRSDYEGILKLLPPDTPFAKQQRVMMEQAIAAERAKYGAGCATNVPTTTKPAGVTVTQIK
jgi:hypothetical protein